MAYHPYISSPFCLSLEGLAKRWDVSRSTVKRVVARGEIPSFSPGLRSVRFRMEDVEAYEERGLSLPRRGDPDFGSRRGMAAEAVESRLKEIG